MSDALLMDRETALEICDGALAASTAEQTEVNVLGSDSGLTRFANNHIHQSVAETDATVLVRAVNGQQVGVASTNDTSEDGLRDVAERACALAEAASPDEEFPGLPAPAEEPAPSSSYTHWRTRWACGRIRRTRWRICGWSSRARTPRATPRRSARTRRRLIRTCWQRWLLRSVRGLQDLARWKPGAGT
ncbi:MAG: PmbA/TldA family metallopeptidase [Armatimonadota bacterium]